MPFGKLRNMKTLLIDDDEFVRDSLRILFESRGCFLLAVRTAEEGIEALRGQEFDVIITDYRLPGMDGLDLCRTLQQTHPQAMKIMITAYSSSAVRDEATTIGVHELIEKPITSRAIEDSLSRLFGLAEP
jgi:CheY-like chemotaxis protein